MHAEVKQTVLPNGVRVISSFLPHVESVSLGLWVNAGGRYEPAARTGISHFVEHMLFKGTATRSARRISEAIEGQGGDLNAFTQEESTCYYARTPARTFAKTLDVLSDMVLHSRFDPAEMERERLVIAEEIGMVHDQPQQRVQEMLDEALWKRHPLGRSLLGTTATLRRTGREDLLDYVARRYTGPHTVVALAGNVAHEPAAAAVARALESLPKRRVASFRRVTESVAQEPVALELRAIEQAHVALGVRLFGRRDPRRFALRVLNVVLGENMSSRLFQVVREKHGLAYSVHSHAQLFHDTGAWTVSAGLERHCLCKALRLIMREMRKLKRTPVRAAELRRAKDYLVGQIQIGWEHTGNQMNWLGENLTSLNRYVAPDEALAAIRKVTADDLRTLAREVLRPEQVSVAAVLPESVALEPGSLRDIVATLEGY